MRWLRSIDRRDVAALIGIAAITYGAAQYSAPLGFIIPGTLLLFAAASAARKGR